MLIVSFPGINGTVSRGARCGFSNDVDITLKWKCDCEVVLIANMFAKVKALDELKYKEHRAVENFSMFLRH